MSPDVKSLVKSISRRMLGVDDPRLFVRRLRRQAQRRIWPTYTTAELMATLAKVGLRNGRTVFVHSSWDEMFNYTGTPVELLDALSAAVGEGGTLAFPAFPTKQDPAVVFDVRRTPSGAGLITELFRRRPGVLRSIHMNHSVCARGPNAKYLTEAHHRSVTSWDRSSPYWRLREVDALIIGLGLGRTLEACTALHCADSILRDELPFFHNVLADRVEYRYRDEQGRPGEHSYYRMRGRLRERRIARYLDRRYFRQATLSNLRIYAVEAQHLIDRTIDLGRRGITMYVDPAPRPELFRPFGSR